MVKDFSNEHARDYDVPGEVDVPMLRVDREPRMRWVSRKSIRPAMRKWRRIRGRAVRS